MGDWKQSLCYQCYRKYSRLGFRDASTIRRNICAAQLDPGTREYRYRSTRSMRRRRSTDGTKRGAIVFRHPLRIAGNQPFAATRLGRLWCDGNRSLPGFLAAAGAGAEDAEDRRSRCCFTASFAAPGATPGATSAASGDGESRNRIEGANPPVSGRRKAARRAVAAILRGAQFCAGLGEPAIAGAGPGSISCCGPAITGSTPSCFTPPRCCCWPRWRSVDRELLLSDTVLAYADALARGAMPIEYPRG